ncbi:MAG: PAS domain-containing sensor histidine kinase [Nitrospirae bacterium]|nr:PAS domain-containing sensor histidine kinase [Nitrospirota bacterium]MBF0536572.1 PAS domain-containing sensor histidine kinase [Nitrospirota bacterium]MBF0615827.1 PAS domain-containing sensor histidine kinase [Nitrospirota bacterium]
MQDSALQAGTLGKMLVISSSLDVIPTVKGMAEFLNRALTEIIGVKSLYICYEGDVFITDKTDFPVSCCSLCKITSHKDSDCALAKSRGFKQLSLRTINNSYGYILVNISNHEEYAAYEPFLGNISNVMTRILENRHITARLKETIEELQYAKQCLERDVTEAQNKAHFGTWTYDPVSQKSKWSLETFKIFGLDPTLVPPLYNVLIKYIHPDDYQRFNEAVKEAIKIGKPYDLDIRINRPDKTERIINIICEPVLSADYKIIRLRGSIIDITDRKHIEDELRNLNKNLETMVISEIKKRRTQEQMLIQQSKMASMGEMIGLIAHQWKQPINAIGLKIQDLKDAYTYDEVDEIYIEKMVDSSMQQIEFMAKTIDDFRNFFIPSKEKIIFSLKSAIDELLSMFIHIFSKSNIDISVKAKQDELFLTEGFPNEFKQVVLNILTNSRDAILSKRKTDDSIMGNIEINIGNIPEYNSKVVVSIKDNGGGIPEEAIEKIFEPYFTTKETEGTGLGLYMSKTIIETNMSGSLTVRNVDGGAEFVISLVACKSDSV